MRIAAVTMVYNESDFLPMWLRHYGRAVGIKHCFVVDHGSDDGSTLDLGGAGYVPLPRSEMNDTLRSAFISKFCSSLLDYYDWVIYIDVDELVVADPEYYDSLQELCEKTTYKVIRCVGLNVHELKGDAPLEMDIPVTLQRQYVRFGVSMCKPLLTCVPIKWTPGFHSADINARFDHLLLFHLAPCDFRINMRKLVRTRSMPWVSGLAGAHQRVSDEERANMLDMIAKLPKLNDLTFMSDDATLSIELNAIEKFIEENPQCRDQFYMRLNEKRPQKVLWAIPQRFKGLI